MLCDDGMKFKEDPFKQNYTGICMGSNIITYSETGLTCESRFTCPLLPAVPTVPVIGRAVVARHGFEFGPCMDLAAGAEVCPGLTASLWFLSTNPSKTTAVDKLVFNLMPSTDKLFANVTFSHALKKTDFNVNAVFDHIQILRRILRYWVGSM